MTTRAASPKFVQEGDSRYMSLELLNGSFTDLTKCDIFSLGISVYEIVTQIPLPANGEYWHQLRHELFPTHHTTTKKLKTLEVIMTEEEIAAFMLILYEMMRNNASLRPTAAELLLRNNLHHHPNHETMMMMTTMTTTTPHNNILPPQPPRQVLTRANTWSGAGGASFLQQRLL